MGKTEYDAISDIIPVPPLQMVLFGGKGGVGKTTAAAAAGICLARAHPGLSVLLVSTDPAHSLADRLGKSPLPSNLSCREFDARARLDAFREKNNGHLREIARRGTFLDDDDIQGFLDLSLPGMDELMAFLDMAAWVEQSRYDFIIVDTAPTGHTLRLLEMPDLSRAWLEALDSLLAKHRYMKKLFSGAYAKDRVDRFILDLSDRIKGFEALLTDPARCAFIPVTLAEPLSLAETNRLVERLAGLNIPTAHILVNRMVPRDGCPACARQRTDQIRCIRDHARLPDRYLLWGVPLFAPKAPDAPCQNSPAHFFFDRATRLDTRTEDREPAAFSRDKGPEIRVSGPMALPGPQKQLLFFAGKGGVGKTTLACAAGVHLSQTFPDRQVFILSTDPAHSLGDCFGRPVGNRPVKVRPNLTLMEADGTREFEELKTLYRDEVKAFLSRMASNMDLTFDREVLERVMDLSPTGVDEIMAVTRALDLMAAQPQTLFILDTAPTGHLVRLLEMPGVMQQWLRMFFNLFLKYRHIFRPGDLTERLVALSKEVKAFRAQLRDPGVSGIYLVAIPTRMAFEETTDLVAACDRLGVRPDGLWLNLATASRECGLCRAIALGESRIRERYDRQFPALARGVVFRAPGPPAGLGDLEILGRAMFRPGHEDDEKLKGERPC
ncbi:MAG: ArsA family ATPase [Desulfobacter sp.]